jgi:hypothetical protein
VLEQQQRAAAALSPTPPPTVLCVEKAYLDGFLAGMAASSVSGGGLPTSSVVLLLVNGGDEPVTGLTMARLAAHAWLAICFATNLHAVPPLMNPARFRPLPLGVMPNNKACNHEATVQAVRARARPWWQRDRRLLVPPMAAKSRARRDYLGVLSQPQFAHLVVVWSGPKRLSFEAFLELMSAHRAVLSPPGGGYDCFRTWQALAVGAAPLVVDDPTFDRRLFHGTGAACVPALACLTAASLADVLDALADPAGLAGGAVRLDTWLKKMATAEVAMPGATELEEHPPKSVCRSIFGEANQKQQQQHKQKQQNKQNQPQKQKLSSQRRKAELGDAGACVSGSFLPEGCSWMGAWCPCVEL